MKEEQLFKMMEHIANNSEAVATHYGTKLQVSLFLKGKEFADECHMKVYGAPRNVDVGFIDMSKALEYGKKSGEIRVDEKSPKELGAVCFCKMLFDLLNLNKRVGKMSQNQLCATFAEVLKNSGDKNVNLRKFAGELGFGPSCENMFEFKYAKDFYNNNSQLVRENTIKKIAKQIKVKYAENSLNK